MPNDNRKAKLRKLYLEKRLQINQLDSEKFSLQAVKNLYKILTSRKITGTIALYHSIKNEINPLGIMDLLNDSTTFALPIIKSKQEMDFCEWKQGDTLNNNQIYPFILEPKIQKIIHPDLVIIPLISFDSNFNRLGYGGGYYDRTIAKEINFRESNGQKKPILIGFAYSCQESHTSIPVDSNDIKLDYVVTEREVLANSRPWQH